MGNPFGSRATLDLPEGKTTIFRLDALEREGVSELARLPYSIRVLLENVLRQAAGGLATEAEVAAVAGWSPQPDRSAELPFRPARVVLQDFTGVPAVVDLAAMRDAMAELGGPAERINPRVQTDLVVDHSVQVDHYGAPEAFARNVAKEMQRNAERYALLRWAEQAFSSFRVVPAGTGIVHQVNLEYLASVVALGERDGERVAFPDTLVGTDSHTTMVNGLGVVGWGVGGIEAEAVMLGQAYYLPLPEVVGLKLVGQLGEGVTATDLVLTVTQMLRSFGVVGRFVELFGPGLAALGVADRATLANMAPEYGATMGFVPVDDQTLRYLEATGRAAGLVARVERYCKEQGLLFAPEAPSPEYSAVLELDLAAVEASVAGPRRPQDRVPLGAVKRSFAATLPDLVRAGSPRLRGAGSDEPSGEAASGEAASLEPAAAEVRPSERAPFSLRDGSVVVAAITSCTNTSNPAVMVGAGLIARKAVQKGLSTRPWVKTSLAPGSKVVTEYLRKAGLLADLEALGFFLVGYGCTTCIGNSGPLAEPIARAIVEHDLVVASVLSGNRNFEARIHSLVRANYLASPMLVVAYALAGRIDIDLTREPLGQDSAGKDVLLRELWPSADEIDGVVRQALEPAMFTEQYASVFEGDASWQALPLPADGGGRFAWDPGSTYIARPPFFEGMAADPAPVQNITGARVLVWLGDTVTTDHISPAGAIPADSPAGRWLVERGVAPEDFNTLGSRRGHHEVMMRGTFGNVRIRNRLAKGREGNVTLHHPSGELTSIYQAAMRYRAAGTPLLVLAGKEYGTGSSRDWAAKGTALLGVKAVLAESYERIHRSNLIGMGVLPLQLLPGQRAQSLGLDGTEHVDIRGIAAEEIAAGATARLRALRNGKPVAELDVRIRLDTQVEVEVYRQGGILPKVLREET